MMIYTIQLEDLETGREAFITVSARMAVESLSPKIKVALDLPYTDRGWHRFVARGTTYIMDERIVAEQEILWECEIRPGRYRSSDHISVERIFTSLGSSILYIQDGSWDRRKVRCTFVQRTFESSDFETRSARR